MNDSENTAAAITPVLSTDGLCGTSPTEEAFQKWFEGTLPPGDGRSYLFGAFLAGVKLVIDEYNNSMQRLGRELEYQTDRANANWKALCECRGEEP